MLKDILDGVEYLHHRGVLHNDLKPDNIIVNSNGAARIIDFGLSGSEDCAYKGCIGGSVKPGPLLTFTLWGFDVWRQEIFKSCLQNAAFFALSECSRLALRDVQDLLFRYNDSLAKIYPMSPTGEYPPEMFSFHRVFKRKALVLDSVVKSMPSIKTLPEEEQAPLLEKYYRSELLH